ncbi:DUF4062 domain-containing protein [Streptomyces goshikiensis]|uniref:DUF4062 domain-containing protein n=1 Tax=Streptomyces TaxID=1883 RepID=UPI000C273E85|nr:DUF4062 domain-containing protein [Streptomyces sp. CB02120-2]PJN15333.1 hypothetical protein CG724_30165 [Streptomyces sp. CB02120-2]
MKIFISSARKGLAKERDALNSLITALGHTPVRFEDFSAQAVPSREACLRALESADVCLFLLGPFYGHVFPETGQSATHDEWVAAQAAGKPSFVYRKEGVEFEPNQHDFVRDLEAYATGRFRDTFHTSEDLTIKIVQKVRELQSAASPLAFAKMVQEPALHWSSDDRASQVASDDPPLELHVLPLDFPGYSARELDQLGASLMERIRATRMIGSDVALNPIRSDRYVGVGIPASRTLSWNTPQEGETAECRLYKTGQLSIRATLPRDGCGPILDPDALPRQIANLLRFAGALNIVHADRVVVAAGVSTEMLMSIDTFDPRRSRQAYQPIGPGRSGRQLRTEPDESVTLAALGAGAAEVAPHLAQVLILQAHQ